MILYGKRIDLFLAKHYINHGRRKNKLISYCVAITSPRDVHNIAYIYHQVAMWSTAWLLYKLCTLLYVFLSVGLFCRTRGNLFQTSHWT